MPSEEFLAATGRYNAELQEAGVLLDLSGPRPSAEGRRVEFSAGNRTVISGPFAEPKELIAGYWIPQVTSMDEAVDWAGRVPFEALARIYPASTAPRARSRSASCSSWSVLTHRSSADTVSVRAVTHSPATSACRRCRAG